MDSKPDRTMFLTRLLERMSLTEKAGQLNLLAGGMDTTGMKNPVDLEEKIRSGRCGGILNVYGPDATRALQEIAMASPAGIPLIFGYDVIHGHHTIFPIPLALSCSWNLDLIGKTARAAAVEAAADGLHWVFSPMVDISWDARWGRVAEGSGEDPWLGSRIATAMVQGYQGTDLAAPDSVAACVKHFALYGAVLAGRDYHTVDMSRRSMEETYFPPYRAAVEAGARTVMTAFNDVNGIPATANRWLLTEILRDSWGFGGTVVTDYTSIAEMKNHATAASDQEAARQSLAAGVNMDMMSEAFINELPELVESGTIDQALVDSAVMRVLELKWDLGLFADPFARARSLPETVAAEHRQLALQAARESIVLLKNDTALLPLAKHRTVAVIGPLADSGIDLLGCWIAAGDGAKAVSPLHGIRTLLGSSRVIHAAGCGIESADESMLDAAIDAANEADCVILTVGESRTMSGEAASRTDIRLPKCQRKLANKILKTGKPCVLVTFSGRPLDLSREAGKFTTILHAWAPGMEGGHALAEVLFGDFAPVGKLTMGFPRHVGQLPMTYRAKATGRPFDAEQHYSSKYLDRSNNALFPFGHGLTYGHLQYGNVMVSPVEMIPGNEVTASIEISNPGVNAVTETVQLYLRDPIASFTRPVKELRGFQRITLLPGESRQVSFRITDRDLAFPGPDFEPITEAGEFIVGIGPDSSTLHYAGFNLAGCP